MVHRLLSIRSGRLLTTVAAACFLGCSSSPNAADAGRTNDAEADASNPEESSHARACASLPSGIGASTASFPLSLSPLVDRLRYFSTQSVARVTDTALLESLRGDANDEGLVLARLADSLPLDSCAPKAVRAAANPPASAKREEGLTFVNPGPGEVVLPVDSEKVVVDLRGFADDELAEEQLRRVVELVAPANFQGLASKVRFYNGQPDEAWGPFVARFDYNVYNSRVERMAGQDYAARNAGARELAVLIDSQTGASALRTALDLKLKSNAFLLGSSIEVRAAEMEWVPVASQGMHVVTRVLLNAGDQPVPDRVQRDSELPAETALQLFAANQLTKREVSGDVLRNDFAAPIDWHVSAIPERTTASLRAALIILHASTRRFYVDLPLVEANLQGEVDRALQTEFAAAILVDQQIDAAAKSLEFQRALLRFGVSLRDGHVFVYAVEQLQGAPTEGARYSPGQIFLTPIGDDFFVSSLPSSGLRLGDQVLQLGTSPIADALRRALSFQSGTNELTRRLYAIRYLQLEAGTSVVVRGVDGVERTVSLQPATQDDYGRPSFPSKALPELIISPAGHKVALINVDVNFNPTPGLGMDALIAQGAEAFVLDDRTGAPEDWSPFITRLLDRGPYIRTRLNEYTGPKQVRDVRDEGNISEVPRTFQGPVAVLVGPTTQSSMESFASIFAYQAHTEIVGRTTSRSNGNITALRLPGEIVFSYTGMGVYHPDGRSNRIVGVPLTREVVWTRDDIVRGRDPDLAEALRALDIRLAASL